MGKARNSKWQRREQAITQRVISAQKAQIAMSRKRDATTKIKLLMNNLRACYQRQRLICQSLICGLLIIALLPGISNPQQAIPFLTQTLTLSMAIVTIFFAIAVSKATLRRRFALIEDDPALGFSFHATLAVALLAAVVTRLS